MRGEEYRKKKERKGREGRGSQREKRKKEEKEGKKRGGFCCGVLFSFIQIPFEARYFFY